ncbi:MAG: DUF2188 domain-containing protein [Chloroflexi bacterium]|nr:DUF2188 domain-containing protein [Chloroflexota bacterium]
MRKVFNVLRQRQGGWDLKKEKKLISHHSTKNAAVHKGMREARKVKPSQLKIFNIKGRIQEERTYGKDPHRYPG